MRPIDADALKYAKLNDSSYIVFKEDVEAMPTLDLKEVRGYWGEQVLREDGYEACTVGYICPVCKQFVPHKGKYCLECGARIGDKPEEVDENKK